MKIKKIIVRVKWPDSLGYKHEEHLNPKTCFVKNKILTILAENGTSHNYPIHTVLKWEEEVET